MVIPCPPEAQTTGYQYRMLGMNRIEGILPCSLRHIDGTGYLYYDITGKQCIAGLYEDRKIPGEELYKLLEDAVSVSGAISEFLLDEQYLLLSQDQVFYDFGTGRYSFVYYPGEIVRPELFRFLADRIDGRDKRAAAAAYRLCSISEGDRQALREAVREEAAQKDMPDPWENWKPEETIHADAGQDTDSGRDPKSGYRAEDREYERGAAVRSRQAVSSDTAPADGRRPVLGARQLLIRIAVIMLSLAGAGGLIAVQLLLYISQREKRLCAAGAILLLITALLFGAEMIARILKERKRRKDAMPGAPDYAESDEKDLPVFGAVSGGDYRLRCEEGNTVRLNGKEIAGRLYGRDRGNRIDLKTLPITIGKAQSFADVVLSDPSISRVHARIYRGEEGSIEIRDLDSTNGTWINGVRISPDEKKTVQRGDEVRFGNVEYEYR